MKKLAHSDCQYRFLMRDSDNRQGFSVECTDGKQMELYSDLVIGKCNISFSLIAEYCYADKYFEKLRNIVDSYTDQIFELQNSEFELVEIEYDSEILQVIAELNCDKADFVAICKMLEIAINEFVASCDPQRLQRAQTREQVSQERHEFSLNLWLNSQI